MDPYSHFSRISGFWTQVGGNGLSRIYQGSNPDGDTGSSTITVTCTWNPVLP